MSVNLALHTQLCAKNDRILESSQSETCVPQNGKFLTSGKANLIAFLGNHPVYGSRYIEKKADYNEGKSRLLL